MSPTAPEVIRAFEGIRRALNDGRYAPHKPLLLLLALARVQRGEARLASFDAIEGKMKTLLAEFGPTNSQVNRHLPYWHLQSDEGGSLWVVNKPGPLASHPLGKAPSLGALRQDGVEAGFAPEIYEALSRSPTLLQQSARRVLEASFPTTLHADITAEVGLDLDGPQADAGAQGSEKLRRRDPAFRDKVLRAYEYRCCVCGFDLRVAHMPAGLEAAHIHWHTAGGPDVVSNGLSLCALHHKLFDLGAFTIDATDRRVVFSTLAISGERGLTGVLAHHGHSILEPQASEQRAGPTFIEWNWQNVFKKPHRSIS